MSKTTLRTIKEKYEKNEKLVMITSYDSLMTEWLVQTDIDMILVGDSVGMVLLGYENTIPVTVEDIIHHTRAVKRVSKNKFVIADMPFMSYQVSTEDALYNAGRIIKETLADAVKIEGGLEVSEIVKRMVQAGIPVMGHIGLNPQHLLAEGGYKVKGRSEQDRERLLLEAKSLEQSGAFSIVIETVPENVGKIITENVSIPTIGIGAGRYTSGQVLVIYDILGMYEKIKPKFVKRYRELGKEILAGINEYINEVKIGKFPDEEHSFK
ncbi:MAG: 3-methyl-2-oxobutanoate hydroxymethyltransferase [Candidatus Hydrogenedentota bacterium]